MSERPRVPRLPIVLLGLMTVFTFGGPVGFGMVLSGGRSAAWPPDRAVEWWTLAGTSGMVAALMAACIVVGLRNSRASDLARKGRSVDAERPER